MPVLTFLALAVALLAGGCAAREPRQGQVSAADAAIAEGRAIAENQCGVCHAVGDYGDSPRAGAPPFRTLLSRYNSDALASDLAEGVRVGHPDMPQFHLPLQGIDSLIAYLGSIQSREPDPG